MPLMRCRKRNSTQAAASSSSATSSTVPAGLHLEADQLWEQFVAIAYGLKQAGLRTDKADKLDKILKWGEKNFAERKRRTVSDKDFNLMKDYARELFLIQPEISAGVCFRLGEVLSKDTIAWANNYETTVVGGLELGDFPGRCPENDNGEWHGKLLCHATSVFIRNLLDNYENVRGPWTEYEYDRYNLELNHQLPPPRFVWRPEPLPITLVTWVERGFQYI